MYKRISYFKIDHIATETFYFILFICCRKSSQALYNVPLYTSVEKREFSVFQVFFY